MRTPIGMLVAFIEKAAGALGISEFATSGLVRATVAAAWLGIAVGAEALAQSAAGVGLPPWATPVIAAVCMGLAKYARARKA